MTPTTAAEEIAKIVHGWEHPDHDGDDCCGYYTQKVVQADRLVKALEADGWLPPTPAMSLPRSAPRGRIEDGEIELGPRHFMVLAVLGNNGPMTDEALTDLYERKVADGSPLVHQTPQSIRSRRAELVKRGRVEATGERRPTKNGGTAQVWRAKSEAGQAAA